MVGKMRCAVTGCVSEEDVESGRTKTQESVECHMNTGVM